MLHKDNQTTHHFDLCLDLLSCRLRCFSLRWSLFLFPRLCLSLFDFLLRFSSLDVVSDGEEYESVSLSEESESEELSSELYESGEEYLLFLFFLLSL